MRNLLLILLPALFGISTCFAVGMAESHTVKNIPCEACHVSKEKMETPTITQCQQCHNLDVLVKQTESVKPRNPHFSPHYQNKLECSNCHIGHEPSENFCGQCHNFDFKVP